MGAQLPAAAAASPGFMDYASLGTGLLGTAVGAYGAYKANETAEKQYEMALKAYEEERDRQARLDAEARRQAEIQNTMSYAGYAQNAQANALQYERPYSAQIGR